MVTFIFYLSFMLTLDIFGILSYPKYYMVYEGNQLI